MKNTADLKQKNMLEIIKKMWPSGSISKPDAARATGLTAVTAHHFLNELTAKGFAQESGISEGNTGRKAVIYKLNPDFSYIVGVNIAIDGFTTTISDIYLNRLYVKQVHCPMEYNDKLLDRMCGEIEEAINKSNIKIADLFGIGVTVPGQAQHRNGVVRNLTNVAGWNDIPIKDYFEKLLKTTVFVDNDNNANALAAKWTGGFGVKSNAVFLSITNGVGMGALVNGSILYGSHSSIGEIGHTTICFDGPVCGCGNKGCIEALTSNSAIINKLNKKTINDVINLAKLGDEPTLCVLKEACGFIGITLEHIIKLYGPEVIIVQNNWLPEFKDMFFYVLDTVFDRCKWIKRGEVEIKMNTIDKINEIGAAALVLEKIFTLSDDNILFEKLKMHEKLAV